MIRKYLSPIGELTLVAERCALIGIRMDELDDYEDKWSYKDENILRRACGWLDQYFSGKEMVIDELIVELDGTEFQKEVWRILQEIPYGQIWTYGEIAQKIMKRRRLEKMSAQAVGQAVGKNPLLILVPCHRVMGVDGKLTGYSGGIEKKIWLLEHEGVLENL